jgi:hypothetical protein
MAIVRAIRSPCATVSAVMASSWCHTFLVPHVSDATLAGVNVLRSNFGAWGAGSVVVAGLLLSTIATFAASPEQLYQTWQKNFLTDPAVSEKAAEDYLRAAPQGPHAQDIKVWLDAYQKAMANLMTQSRKAGQTVAQNAAQNAPRQAPADKQAAAKPAPAVKLATAQPLKPAPAARQQAAPPASAKPGQAQQVARDIKGWFDASEKAVANLVTQSRKAIQTVAQSAPKQAPANKQATAKPAQQAPQPKPQPAPAVKLATAEPPKQSPAPQVAHAAPPATPPAAPAVEPATAPPGPASQPAAKQPESRTASATARENPARENEASNTAPARPPAAKPPAQSVDGMLAFIADKVESEDPLDFTAVFINAAGGELVERLSYEASNVTIDPNRCLLSYRWHVVQDGRGMPDEDRAVQLRLSKSISVETIDQALGDLNDNHFTVRAAPQAYAVHIARWDKPSGDNLYFRDRDMAETVAGAAQQALELCDKAAARFGN